MTHKIYYKNKAKSLSDPNIEKMVEIEMMNIIILEGIESDFGIALQLGLIKSITRALM